MVSYIYTIIYYLIYIHIYIYTLKWIARVSVSKAKAEEMCEDKDDNVALLAAPSWLGKFQMLKNTWNQPVVKIPDL